MQSSARAARARHRLSTVTAGDVAPLPEREPSLPEREPSLPKREPSGSEPPIDRSLPDPRGWRERWLPASWRGARVDPGRRGALALAAVAAVAAVLTALGVWRDRPVPQLVPALPLVAAAPAPTTPVVAQKPEQLVVSVAGAVVTPGLVTLKPGSRVADALAAAGGALPGTDLLTLNLAQPLSDGQQVVVGAGGPIAVGGPTAGSVPSGNPAAPGTPGAGLLDLNTATAAELDELPGVGPVMAKAIVDWRTQNGGFRSVEQLNDVSGVGDARFAQLKDLVRV